MNKRNQGIDLLRIIFMMMICMYHVLNHGGILTYTTSDINYYTIWFLESLSKCAVDGYALISGYFASDSKPNYKRIINLWLTALFYSAGITILIKLINTFTGLLQPISSTELLRSFMPVCFGNWYFQAYFVIFFITPFINRSLDSLDEKTSKKTLIIFFIIFSVLSLIQDNHFAKGYSAFWLLILYIIGALIKKTNLFDSIKSSVLFICYLLCSVFIVLLDTIFNTEIWRTNTSPLILLSAIFLLIIFSRININSKLVKTIAPLTFGIYLFHDNDYFRKYFMLDKFAFVNNYNIFVCILLIIVISLVIFVVSMIVEYIRNQLFRLLKIDSLIDKIASKID